MGYLRITLSFVAMAYQGKIVLRHVRDGLELARFASLSSHEKDLEAPCRDSIHSRWLSIPNLPTCGECCGCAVQPTDDRQTSGSQLG